MWMSRVNGQVEVDGRKMVWELTAEVWWSGEHSACKKLEAAQMSG